MSGESGEQKVWKNAEYDEQGLTQWFWRVLHPENFELGKNVQIGSFTAIDAMKGVRIEDDVKIGFNCTILSYSSIDRKEGKVILRKGCKLGSNSVVMPGVTLGEGAIVGANSFVSKDIPPREVWVGSPARFLKGVNEGKS